MKLPMKLDSFLIEWRRDGTRLIELCREYSNGAMWLLFAIYLPESSADYGCHMALILKCDREEEILKHDMTNLHGEINSLSKREIEDWFRNHVGKY